MALVHSWHREDREALKRIREIWKGNPELARRLNLELPPELTEDKVPSKERESLRY